MTEKEQFEVDLLFQLYSNNPAVLLKKLDKFKVRNGDKGEVLSLYVRWQLEALMSNKYRGNQ